MPKPTTPTAPNGPVSSIPVSAKQNDPKETSITGLMGDFWNIWRTWKTILKPEFFSIKKKESLRHQMNELKLNLEGLIKTASPTEKPGLSLLRCCVTQANEALGLLEGMTPSKLMGLCSAQMLASAHPMLAGTLNTLLGNWSGDTIQDLGNQAIAKFDPLLLEICDFLKQAGTSPHIIAYITGDFFTKNAKPASSVNTDAEILAKIAAFEMVERRNAPLRKQAAQIKEKERIAQAAKEAHKAVINTITEFTDQFAAFNTDKKDQKYKAIKALCAQLLAKAKDTGIEKEIHTQLKSLAANISNNVKKALLRDVAMPIDDPVTSEAVQEEIENCIYDALNEVIATACMIDEFSENEVARMMQESFNDYTLRTVQSSCIKAAAQTLAVVIKGEPDLSKPEVGILGSGFVRLRIVLTNIPLPYPKMIKQLFPDIDSKNAQAWAAVGNSLHGIITLLQKVIPSDLNLANEPVKLLKLQGILSPRIAEIATSAISHMSPEDQSEMMAEVQLPLHVILMGIQVLSQIYTDGLTVMRPLFMGAEANVSEETKSQLAQVLNQSVADQKAAALAIIQAKRDAGSAVLTQASSLIVSTGAISPPLTENDPVFAKNYQYHIDLFLKNMTTLEGKVNALEGDFTAIIKSHYLLSIQTPLDPEQSPMSLGGASRALLNVLQTLSQEAQYLQSLKDDKDTHPLITSMQEWLNQAIQIIFYDGLSIILAHENTVYLAITKNKPLVPGLLSAIAEGKEHDYAVTTMGSAEGLQTILNYVKQNLIPAVKKEMVADEDQTSEAETSDDEAQTVDETQKSDEEDEEDEDRISEERASDGNEDSVPPSASLPHDEETVADTNSGLAEDDHLPEEEHNASLQSLSLPHNVVSDTDQLNETASIAEIPQLDRTTLVEIWKQWFAQYIDNKPSVTQQDNPMNDVSAKDAPLSHEGDNATAVEAITNATVTQNEEASIPHKNTVNQSSYAIRNRWIFGLTAFAATAAAFGAGYALPSVGAAIGLGLVGVGLSAATGGIFAGAVALIMLAVFVGLYCSGVFSKKLALPPVKPFLPLTQNALDSSAIGGPSPAVTPALTAAASNTAAPTAADPKETNARKHSLTSENSGESSLPLSRL